MASSWDLSEEIASYFKEIHGEPESNTNIEKRFHVEHAFFRWSLEKISDFPEVKNLLVLCESPVFQLKETSWRIKCCPTANICGKEGIFLKLVRHEEYFGPEKVGASFRLGVENSLNKIWFEEIQFTFRKGDVVPLQTSVLGYMQDFDNADNVSILCEIYVSYLSNSRNERDSISEREISEIDETLPRNMATFFRKEQKMDAVIEIRDHRILAHKCILSARSKTFKRLLKEDTSFIQLCCSFSCLKCIILYLYTGSFDYLAKNAIFSIGLYETASVLSLSTLRDWLIPHQIKKKSQIVCSCIQDVYTQNEFRLCMLLLDKCYEMPSLSYKNTGLAVGFRIFKRGPSTNFSVIIEFKISGISNFLFDETYVSLLDENQKEIPAKCMNKIVHTNSVFITAFQLSSAQFLSSDMTNGYIRVQLSCTLHHFQHVSENIENNINDRGMDSIPDLKLFYFKPIRPWRWINELSNDFLQLLKTGQLSDVIVTVEKRRFKLHRFILAARSTYFYSLFFEKNYSQDVLIEFMRARTFYLMIVYIYCGTIGKFYDLIPDDFIELYKASIKFGIMSLLKISALCLEVVKGPLRLDFGPNNVLNFNRVFN